MKKPFDFLFTDKVSFLVFTKCKIMMKDGFLVSVNKDGIKYISPGNLAMALLDVGTSITHDAVNELTKHDCIICYTNAGFNIHSVFKEGRYSNPHVLINQVLLQKDHKLKVAKDLLKIRVHLIQKYNKTVKINLNFEEAYSKIDCFENENQLLGKEGAFVRFLYEEYSKKFNIKNFKRDFEIRKASENIFDKQRVNERLNKLNNALYSFCCAICLSYGLSPSIDFLHGISRRGGLAFDLADLIKPVSILDLSFDKNIEELKIYSELRNVMSKNNYFYTKLLFFICEKIGEGNKDIFLEYLKIYDK